MPRQWTAVQAKARRLLVVAGAGSGKTEVIARRIAWLVSVGGLPKESIVAFTFTEGAAEEMQFRVRRHFSALFALALGRRHHARRHVRGNHPRLLPQGAARPCPGHLPQLRRVGGRGAAHRPGRASLLEFCLAGRFCFRTPSGPPPAGIARGHFATIPKRPPRLRPAERVSTCSYVELPEGGSPPGLLGLKRRTVARALRLRTRVGTGTAAKAFATSAARYYALLRCRRFLDFSTSQAELLRLLRTRPRARTRPGGLAHLVVDELQDVNLVQSRLIRRWSGTSGSRPSVTTGRRSSAGAAGASTSWAPS